MKRIFAVVCSIMLVLSLASCNSNVENSSSLETSASPSTIDTENNGQTSSDRQIQITANAGNVIVFALNDSTAAKELYAQLPLSVKVENYSSNEKIFYPPNKLDTSAAPLAKGPAGTLAYYAPWGDVVMYYGDSDGARGLYQLGTAVSGTEYISELTGEIRIEAIGANAYSSETAKSERTTASQGRESSEISLGNITNTPPQAESSQTHRPPYSQPSIAQQPTESNPTSGTTTEATKVEKMQVQIGNSTFTATLSENAAVNSFVEIMQRAPVVINMRDYAGFEKVGSLGTSLPANNHQITTHPGDIVLYNGNQIVVFYGSNLWSYTKLGKIDNLTGWKEALGSGDVTITFLLN